MSHYEDSPTGRSWRSLIKPLMIVAVIGFVGWYAMQGSPSKPEARAGEVVWELQLTPL